MPLAPIATNLAQKVDLSIAVGDLDYKIKKLHGTNIPCSFKPGEAEGAEGAECHMLSGFFVALRFL